MFLLDFNFKNSKIREKNFRFASLSVILGPNRFGAGTTSGQLSKTKSVTFSFVPILTRIIQSLYYALLRVVIVDRGR